jgi:hypothetical protein
VQGLNQAQESWMKQRSQVFFVETGDLTQPIARGREEGTQGIGFIGWDLLPRPRDLSPLGLKNETQPRKLVRGSSWPLE